VLIEEKQDNRFTGRTEYDAPDVDNTISFEIANELQLNDLKIGDFVNVKVSSAEEYELFGELV
jgi:ribosomal protein S12 methylthiotransferase